VSQEALDEWKELLGLIKRHVLTLKDVYKKIYIKNL